MESENNIEKTERGSDCQKRLVLPLMSHQKTAILTDEEIEEITRDAYSEYRKWSRGTRGQTITYMDAIEFWVIQSTLRFIERKHTPCSGLGVHRENAKSAGTDASGKTL